LIKQGEEPEVESVKRTNLASIPGATLKDYFELNAARRRTQAAFQQFWLQNRLDALLYPGAPTTATPLDEWSAITYTMLWNLLDYPALIIPTGKVCNSDIADGIENATFGPQDQKNYSLCKSISPKSLSV
jgi:amidase